VLPLVFVLVQNIFKENLFDLHENEQIVSHASFALLNSKPSFVLLNSKPNFVF